MEEGGREIEEGTQGGREEGGGRREEGRQIKLPQG